MNNIKVQTKMIMVILATMAALVLCTIFSAQSMMELQSRALETMETDERDSYDEQIKQQVDNVISLCQTIYDQYQEGVYTEAEAKKLAADEIRQLRYGDSGYFWIDQEVQQRVPTVWRPRMPTDIRWSRRSSEWDRSRTEAM